MKNHKWSKTSCKSFNPGYPDSDKIKSQNPTNNHPSTS